MSNVEAEPVALSSEETKKDEEDRDIDLLVSTEDEEDDSELDEPTEEDLKFIDSRPLREVKNDRFDDESDRSSISEKNIIVGKRIRKQNPRVKLEENIPDDVLEQIYQMEEELDPDWRESDETGEEDVTDEGDDDEDIDEGDETDEAEGDDVDELFEDVE